MSRRKERRLALLGAFGVDNYGNDETLHAAIAGVRRAAARLDVELQLSCVCSNTERVAAESGLPTLSLTGARDWGSSSPWAPVRLAGLAPRTIDRLVAAVRALRRVDTLCVAGTGTLDDQHVRPTQLPLDLAVWCVAARVARTPVLFASVGAGPIDHWASRLCYRAAARCARRVSYRDRPSREYMRRVGRDVERDGVAPDLVFGRYDVRERSAVEPRSRPCAALGVLQLGHWPDESAREGYLQRLTDVVHGLWEAGFDVRLIEGDVHDRPAVAELAARLAGEACDRLDVPRIRSFDDVMDALASCTVTIASRYHNLVAALLVGRPVVSLEYGFKNSALMADFGLGDFCHQIADFSPSRVVQHARQLASDRGFEVRCNDTAAEMRRVVDRQWDEMLR